MTGPTAPEWELMQPETRPELEDQCPQELVQNTCGTRAELIKNSFIAQAEHVRTHSELIQSSIGTQP